MDTNFFKYSFLPIHHRIPQRKIKLPIIIILSDVDPFSFEPKYFFQHLLNDNEILPLIFKIPIIFVY